MLLCADHSWVTAAKIFSAPPSFTPFRIFKDARKDKGQDDFLGNVVLRLKVSAAVHPLLQMIAQVSVKPPGLWAGSHPCGSTELTQDPTSEPQIDTRFLSLVASAPATPARLLSDYTSCARVVPYSIFPPH